MKNDVETDQRYERCDAVAIGQHPHPVDATRVAVARAGGISAEDTWRLAATLSLFADPVRARILYVLDLVEELCVGDIALALDATEDVIGYALKLLRTVGLVATRKQGRAVFYRLADDVPVPLCDHCLRQLVRLSRADGDTGREIGRAWR